MLYGGERRGRDKRGKAKKNINAGNISVEVVDMAPPSLSYAAEGGRGAREQVRV